MMKPTIDPKLSHLSPEEIETLISRYYAKKDRVDELIREYQINCSTASLSALFPHRVLHNQYCRYCDVPMIQARHSRSSGASRLAYCPECGHKKGLGGRTYRRCSVSADTCDGHERVDPEFDSIGSYTRLFLPNNLFTDLPADIDLRNAVSLLALVRACLILELKDKMVPEDYPLTLNPIASAAVPFAPTTELCSEYLNALMGRGLVSLSELSEGDAFVFKRGSIDGYYLYLVRWILTIDEPMTLIKNIELLARRQDDWPAEWHASVKGVWIEIAFSECKQFYTYCSEQRGFPVPESTSMDMVLFNLLQDYSAGQCNRIIYASAQKAADFLVRRRCHPMHAANYMLGECQRWMDQARMKKWEVKPFKRNFDLPRTTLSFVFFDVFLGIGEEGFNSVPRDTP